MTHFGAGILSLLLAATAASAQAGPLGYWRGDDGTAPTTAADSSGNGRSGTYTSGATTSSATLPPGLFQNQSAFSLDGTDDQIVVPHNAAFNLTGDITIAFWMRKTAEAGDWQRLVGKGAPAVRTFGVWEESGGGARILFQQYNGAGGSVLDVFSAGTVPLNTWTHVACTVAGTAATVYLNGASNATGTRSGVPGTDTQPVRIGYGEIHTYFPGQLDEVRIFDRALSLAEIQSLAGLTPLAAPTLSGTPFFDRVDLTWTAVAGASSYTVLRGPSGTGPWTAVATGVTGLSYSDTSVSYGTTYFYTVYAVGLVDGPSSTPALQMVVPFPPPRTNDHDEGLIGDSCSCGASIPVPGPGWAPLLLLLWTLRRRRG